jgi:hypothetical protein
MTFVHVYEILLKIAIQFNNTFIFSRFLINYKYVILHLFKKGSNSLFERILFISKMKFVNILYIGSNSIFNILKWCNYASISIWRCLNLFKFFTDTKKYRQVNFFCFLKSLPNVCFIAMTFVIPNLGTHVTQSTDSGW